MAASKQADTDVQEETPLPEGWRKAVTLDRKAQFYYVSHNDHFTTWEDPRIYDPEPVQQEQSVLEYIIRAYNFLNADQSDKERQRQEIYKNYRHCSTEGNEEILEACFNALKEQICVKNFPPPHSVPQQMAANIIEKLHSMLHEWIENGRITKTASQHLLFEFILSLLQYGPGSSASYMISERLSRWVDMEDYLKALRGERFTRMIDSLKAWHYVPEDRTKFITECQSYFWSVSVYRVMIHTIGNYKSKKVNEPEIHQQILELYFSYFTKVLEVPDDYINYLEHIMTRIAAAYTGKYDENPYQVLQKPDILRTHLQTVRDIICSDKFQEKHVDISRMTVTSIVSCIKKKHWLVILLDDILDVMKKYFLTESGHLHKVFSEVLELLKETTAETYDENPQIMNKMFTMFQEVLQKKPEHMPWAYYYITVFSEKFSARRGSEAVWFPLMKVMMKTMHRKGVFRCHDTFRQQKFQKIWNWKKNYQEALDIIEPIKEAYLHLNGDDKDGRFLENCGNTLRTLLDQFKVAKVSAKLNGHIAEWAMTFMEKKTKQMSRFVEKFIREIKLEGNQEVIPGLIQRYKVLLYDRDFMLDDYNNFLFGYNFLESFIDAYSSGKEIPHEVNQTFIEMFLWVMQTQDLEYVMDHRDRSVYGRAATEHLQKFVSKHQGKSTSDVIVPLIPALVKQMKHEDTDLVDSSRMIVYMISIDDYKLLRGHLGALVEWYKETQSDFALRALWKPLEDSDGFTTEDFYFVINTIAEDTGDSKAFLHGMLCKLMAERQAELFTREHVDMMVERFLDEKLSQGSVLLALGEIIASKPEIIGDNIIKNVLQNPNLEVINASSIRIIAVNLGLKKKELVNVIFEELIALAKCWHDPNHQIHLLDSVRILGSKYGVEALRPHRKYFEDLQKYGMSSPIKDTASAIVNAMDGVSMEGIITDVIQTKRKVEVLDQTVKKAVTEVSGMKTTVAKQTKDIKAVESGLKTVEKRVDIVEKDLDETKMKVEEIDNKTLSNAPAWSKDVSKLMNPKSEHDWRLLAQRLGYTLDDIKAWATHSDPCMALLSEWFATHKMMEATYAVLNILQDINRLDAAVIVENAMKCVENVVEEAPEYNTPPPIFLSYQWGHQNEVKLLRQHLLMAGYECWMDVGQMGGGDKLFQKIDNGIRGAKVVICCVSEKYAKSPNCNREVNLSVNLGKPMIPLLMEKMGWPPQGSMGPIFSEYLFVRFFQRKGEETKDQRYWPVPKFQELLMQLNIYKTMPDESLITKEYRNWWVPVTEDIIINTKSKNEGEGASGTSEDKDKEIISPDVFLSYQWGKQKQVKLLYKRLTELGLTCWMDIYQMGGGDSLFDKIDRGVRGCKVVLTCATTKYTVSPNCRREVSLADSLKKPVVSLLLESMKWPPNGPMSSALSQSPLVDLSNDEIMQTIWTGDKFDELLAEIMEIVPNIIGYVKDVRKKESQSQQKTTDGADVVANTSEGRREAQQIEEAQGDAQKNQHDSTTPNTGNLQAPTVNPAQKRFSGEKIKAGLAESLNAEEEEKEEELPPSYDSLFSQPSSSASTTTKNKPSPSSPPQPKKKSSKPPPPPYPYQHHYVETPTQPTKTANKKSSKHPDNKKSSSCVIT